MSSKISFYLYCEHANDLPARLSFAKKNHCDILITPIVNPLFTREFENKTIAENHLHFTRSDLIMEHANWSKKIVAKLSDYIDCDSLDESIRKHSEKTLKQEIAFAQHLSSEGPMLIKLKRTNTVNLARIIGAEIQGIYKKINQKSSFFKQLWFFLFNRYNAS